MAVAKKAEEQQSSVVTQQDDVDVMPPKVAAAIIQVMTKVQKLEKDQVNKHGGYKYAGIDAYLDEVRQLEAEAGLIVTQTCEGMEFRDAQSNGKVETWVCCQFSYTFAHESGETWLYRPRNWAMARASMGSQAMGTAEAYGMKNMHRMTFKIATGENLDVDTQPAGDLPRSNGKSNGNGNGNGKPVEKIDTKLSEEASLDAVTKLVEGLQTLEDETAISDFWKKNQGVFGRLLPKHQQAFKDAGANRRAELKGGADNTPF